MGRPQRQETLRLHDTSSKGLRRRPFSFLSSRMVWGLLLLLVVGLAASWIRLLLNVASMQARDNHLSLPTRIQPSPTASSFSKHDWQIAQPVYGTFATWDDDLQVVFAFPEKELDNNRKPLFRGIALLLHGCSHNALKFFSPSETSCPDCVGLAEEVMLTRRVLARDYAVLAVTSRNRKSGCWSDTDLPRLKRAVELFQGQPQFSSSERNYEPLPIIAIGASSGGNMAARVAVSGLADAAIVMVMGLGSKLVQEWKNSPRTIPIYFAPMPRDGGTLQRVKQNHQQMINSKKSNAVILDESTCVERPVTADYLVSHVVSMTPMEAKCIIQALVDAHHLRQNDGMLQKDPTKSDWRNVLIQLPKQQCSNDATAISQKAAPNRNKSLVLLWEKFVLTVGLSPLAKALHRAWAYHEYCSEAVWPALDFFEKVLHSEDVT